MQNCSIIGKGGNCFLAGFAKFCKLTGGGGHAILKHTKTPRNFSGWSLNVLHIILHTLKMLTDNTISRIIIAMKMLYWFTISIAWGGKVNLLVLDYSN